MDENESHEWIHRMAIAAVTPTTYDPQKTVRLDVALDMVDKLTSFGVSVLKAASEVQRGDDDPTVQYIASLEADVRRLGTQKIALACGVALAADLLRNPRPEKFGMTLYILEELFALFVNPGDDNG